MKFHIPETERYEVSFGNRIVTVDSLSSEHEFDVEYPGVYMLSVAQIEEQCLPLALRIVLYPIASVICGLFSILTFDTAADWEKNIRGFLLKSQAELSIEKDAEYDIAISNSSYNSISKQFSLPKQLIDGRDIAEYQIKDNSDDINRQCGRFIFKLTSCFEWLLALFIFLLYVSFTKGIIAAQFILTALLLMSSVGYAVRIVRELKKKKQLRKMLCNAVSDDNGVFKQRNV